MLDLFYNAVLAILILGGMYYLFWDNNNTL